MLGSFVRLLQVVPQHVCPDGQQAVVPQGGLQTPLQHDVPAAQQTLPQHGVPATQQVLPQGVVPGAHSQRQVSGLSSLGGAQAGTHCPETGQVIIPASQVQRPVKGSQNPLQHSSFSRHL